MKVAVTGAGGFIGRHVLEELLQRRGIEIVAASRTGMIGSISDSNVNHVAVDIGTISPGDAFDRLGRPEIVVHLAWGGLPGYKSLHHFEDQLELQYRFLRGLVRAGLPSLFCAGTCFEYGMRSGPLSEDMATNPRNPYGYAKDALHRQLQFLQGEHPFDLTWARLFYMYGHGQPASSLFTQFQAAGKRGDPSFRMSGGEQLRDFLPVRRVAQGIVALALEASGSGAVNICSGRPVSVRSLVEEWRTTEGWEIALELGHYPYADYEPMAFWGSAARLNRLLPALATSWR